MEKHYRKKLRRLSSSLPELADLKNAGLDQNTAAKAQKTQLSGNLDRKNETGKRSSDSDDFKNNGRYFGPPKILPPVYLTAGFKYHSKDL